MVYSGVRWSTRDVAIEGFVDSDFAWCLNIIKSLIDYVFNAYCITINWKANLHKVVTLSTAAAKYVVMKKVVKEALWLKGLAKELKV